ncbi:hypothetical protein CCR75_008717 [Bremia lactucae]|uniref:Uncharacterized protein n=1 Tax=Bremia lactucae TaxID=4779 RepID=A0A976IK94_BRELC|nr:hypothetical protein CCR75_008717 [Bremia lactucae]
MDMRDVVAQVQTLEALRLFVAAFDAGQVAPKPARFRITPDAVLDENTPKKIFYIQQKQFSLHRQRTLLDVRNELPVATLRLSMFNRTPTYSAYRNTEHEEILMHVFFETTKTPCSFKFTVDDISVRSEFTDLVGGQHCTIGCDFSTVNSDSLTFWLVRGSGETIDVQQTIARLNYINKGLENMSVVVDIAPGVDQIMMILICIGLLDEGVEDDSSLG